MRSAIILGMAIVLLVATATAKDLKRDPDTGLIRVYYIGAPFWASPYQVYKYDPLISATPIAGNMYGLPATMVQRAMRLYMPRSKEDMVSKCDIIGLDDTTWYAFPPQSIHWMTETCRENALGLFMAGGFESFGGGTGFPSWETTVLDEVMPVKCVGGYPSWDGMNTVTNPDDVFIRSVPWDEYDQHNMFDGYNVVELKQGAIELSQVTRLGSTGAGIKDPGWVWWDVGNGRFFASAPGFRGGSAGMSFILWKHYQDFVCNMVYFLAGLTPPSDINLLYATRQRFKDIYDQNQVITGTIDFISRFGADTRKVDSRLSEADVRLDDARARFVDLELVESKQIADEVFGMLQDAYDLALDARDVAMYWIFVTEWLVVSATGLICGFAVWTLMIKRRLYREVKVTRGGGAGG